MFQRILVPVDGSELSGRILLQVQRLLEAGELVSLLRVVHSGASAADLRRAGQALDRTVATLQSQGISAEGLVLSGEPAAVILTQASLTEPALIAMSTHGSGGLGRWLRGSVAERVLRRCPVPLLLVNPGPQDRAEPGARFRRILVPLDGSPSAASILPLVSRVAKVCGSEVVLFRAGESLDIPSDVEYVKWAPPGPREGEVEVRAALDRRRARLEVEGVHARTVALFEGGVVEGILQTVEREGIDLVALTTHGRSSLDRWLFGSVADKVLRLCTMPLLVQRVAGHIPWGGDD